MRAAYQRKGRARRPALLHRESGYFTFFFEVPFAVVLPDAAVLADALLSAAEVDDWLPVVEPAVVLIDWSPVVALVELESDWSPVLVVLSIVRLERPRRSMLGAKFELEPVTAELVVALDPVTAELTLVLEPVTEGLLVALAVEFEDARFAAELLGLGELADASGMQSWWTALFEWSLATPVSLLASLPACGWPSSLQSGLVAVAAIALVAPKIAATASALMYRDRIMVLPPRVAMGYVR